MGTYADVGLDIEGERIIAFGLSSGQSLSYKRAGRHWHSAWHARTVDVGKPAARFG